MEWFFDHLENDVPFSFARFNDGEMIAINRVGSTVARGDQTVSSELSESLKEALGHKQDRYYIGVPCSICYPRHNQSALSIVGEYEYLTNAVVTTNMNWKNFVDRFPKAMKGRRMIWIGGDDQDVEPLKIMGLNVAKFAKLPRRNSWRYYRGLREKIPQYFEPGDFVGISLGPTARVLARQWFEEFPDITFVDMGSNFDPFTRNVRHNCHKGWDSGFNLAKICKHCNYKK